MSQNEISSLQQGRNAAISAERSTSTFLSDLKALFKGPVLLANVVPVFTGLWLAIYFNESSLSEHWGLFLLTLIGSTLVMGGALVINNWYDVDIDTIMARTKHRPTVTGHIPLKTVLMIGIITSVLGFILLLFTTPEAVFYAFIGWFTYVFLYTMWSKRRFTWNTIIGSISGAVTPLIGWAALEPKLSIVPIAFFLILFVWQMPHTFAISMKKYDEYKAAKVAMLPVVKGFEVTKRQFLIYIILLLPIPFLLVDLGITYVVIATMLTIGFLGLSIASFYMKDDSKWARIVFVYSVNYLMILFLLAVFVTLPIFN